MIGNIALLISAFLFICIISFYLFKIWPDVDLIDLYIIFVLLHFGFYPFIRGLYFGGDAIFDFRNSNPIAIGLIFAHVLAIIVMIRILSSYFPRTINNYLNIRYLINQFSHINKYVLISIYVWLILFQLISYYKYGIVTYIFPEDLEKVGKNLPYWFTSMRTIYNIIAFCTFLGLFSKIVSTKNFQRYVWIILTIIFVPVVTIYGRRFLIDMIVVSVIFWLIYKKENIFQLRYLKVVLALLVVFFLFSNIYQSYRHIFHRVGKMSIESFSNLFVAALDFNSTINNLKKRPGTWEFNFLVFNNQLINAEMTTNGKITWEGFKSSIPRIFWPSKQFDLIDNIVGKLYNVETKTIDIGKNLFGVVQLDFCYYSLIIIPAIILFIFIVMGVLLNLTDQYPTFSCLLSGNILFFIINIEENGNEIFFMFRNILIILMLWGLYVLANKIYLTFLSKKVPT